MSLEQKIDELTAAVTTLTAALYNTGGVPADVPADGRGQKTTTAVDDQEKAEPTLVWYHKPETKEVWQEEETSKRKGIVKVAEKTAKELIAKYEAEAEQAEESDSQADESTESGSDNFDDMGLDGEDDTGQTFDESQPMTDAAFAPHWREFTKAAVQKAMDNGAADQEEAQTEVKKFVVPLVKEFGEGDKPKIASIPEEKRAAFLNRAQAFFA